MTESYREQFGLFAKALSESGQRYLFALEEDATRAHVQGYFTSPSNRPDTFKSFVKKFVKFDPLILKLTNKNWSCTEDKMPDTWQRYVHYCCKENKILFSSHTTEEISQFRVQYLIEEKQIESNLKKGHNNTFKDKCKDRQAHYESLCNRIEDYIDRHSGYNYTYVTDDVPECESEFHVCRVQLDLVTRYVIEEYEDTFFTVTMLEPIIHRLMLKYDPSYKIKLTNRITSRIMGFS